MLILLGAMSPVGNNVLSYALITDGDVEMATNVISLSNIVSFYCDICIIVDSIVKKMGCCKLK